MRFDLSTNQPVETVDVTDRVADGVPDAHSGTCTVFVPHTTAGITVNEPEPRLLRDLESLLEELAPAGAGYEHDTIDDNAAAHLRSLLLGADVTLPVADGELGLGTWQSILFVESDGPRNRTVTVHTD